jgi:AraC-like DNA-binding protein
MNRPILVRSRYAANFLAVAGQHGIPLELPLRQCALDRRVIDEPDRMISAYQLTELASNLALSSGKLDLGLDAANVAGLDEHGSMSQVVEKGSLVERLYEFCVAAALEYSQVAFFVKHTAHGIHFVRSKIPGSEPQVRQIELYVFKLMMDTIRIDLGRDWFSRRIELQSQCRAEIGPEFEGPRTRAYFGQPETRIFIAHSDLHSAALAQLCRLPEGVNSNGMESFAEFVSTLVYNHLGDSRLTLRFIAGIAGIHLRELQRQLKDEGRSFSLLLGQIRMSVAKDALENSALSISDISDSLGYSNQSHFSRAFQRNVGMPPFVYRRISKT